MLLPLKSCHNIKKRDKLNTCKYGGRSEECCRCTFVDLLPSFSPSLLGEQYPYSTHHLRYSHFLDDHEKEVLDSQVSCGGVGVTRGVSRKEGI